MSLKVLLADGNVVVRPVIAKVLREEPAVERVGEATSFAETRQRTAALKPAAYCWNCTSRMSVNILREW
jgi:DNA-binding NarL/FixJ family response regulator